VLGSDVIKEGGRMHGWGYWERCHRGNEKVNVSITWPVLCDVTVEMKGECQHLNAISSHQRLVYRHGAVRVLQYPRCMLEVRLSAAIPEVHVGGAVECCNTRGACWRCG
jgi:hypothetical protein